MTQMHLQGAKLLKDELGNLCVGHLIAALALARRSKRYQCGVRNDHGLHSLWA